MLTVAQLINELADRFAGGGLWFGHGTDNPWDEAVALVLGVTGLPDDHGQGQVELQAPTVRRLRALADERVERRVPVPYLLGKMRFRGREFLIEPGVVVPRSPIAELIEQQFRPWLLDVPRAIVDLGCGTGCLGILCAQAFPDAEITLVDLDPQAVALARRNVAAHGLEDRVAVLGSDLFDEVPPRRWDVIVANPPYVDDADMAALPLEYRHEPAVGLSGGADGLAVLRRLLRSIPERLGRGGLLVGEAGASSPRLLQQFARVPFIWPDLVDGGEGVFLLPGESLDDPAVVTALGKR